METEFVDFGAGPIVKPGKTTIFYKPDGNEIIVGSADSQVSVFKTTPDSRKAAEATVLRHMEEISCLAVNGARFVTAGTDGLVITYKNNEFERILIRSSVAVRSVAFNPEGLKLAIAGDDNDIRVVLVSDNSKIVSLKGHTTSLKCVEYDPSGEYIISSSCDGDVRIWSVGASEPAPRCVKVLKNIMSASKADHSFTAKVSWSPDRSCFAFPGKNNDIRMYTNGMWTPHSVLNNGHTEIISTFSWSPNGYYMATTSEDKLLIIWDVQNKKIVRKAIVVTLITEIAWSPVENQLVFANETGEVFYWDKVIPESNSNLPHPSRIRQNIQKELLEAQSQDPYSLEQKSLEPLSNSRFLDTIASDEDGEDLQSEGDDVDMIDAEDDFVIDDDGAGYTESMKEQERLQNLHQQRMNMNASRTSAPQSVVFNSPSTFQPGETPYNKENRIEPKEGERRYLCFNLVGAIYTIYQDDHSVINAELHDQTMHRNFHFTDYSNFTMAALSESGAVFAVESKEAPPKQKKTRITDDGQEETEEEEEEEFTASVLHYRPLTLRAGGDKDWTFNLPSGEDVIAVAINNVSVIAATSAGFIRVLSLSGVQRHIFSLGNIVTLAAMNDLAFLVFATGPGFTGEQNLEYLLINSETNDVLQKDKIQLTGGSWLTWAGFSETTQIATYDSQSILRVLHRQRRPNQGTWVPIFDGKVYAKSIERSEKYWPVGVLRDRLMCVVLRGENKYPFFPRPAVSEAPLELPLIEPTSETGQIEQAYLSSLYRNLHERDEAEATQKLEEYQDSFDAADIELDKDILRLINLACKAERPSRALDLTHSLRLSESVDKAIRVATYHHLSNLATNLMRIKETKFRFHERVNPVSLNESYASQPSLFESNIPTLENGLSLLEKSEIDTRKRLTVDDDDDVSMGSLEDSSQRKKKPKPFQFSQT
ncbi:WD40-repeat-containing domain protein [Sporodiniella umbellata]|nr:WD40-repeat-containing domain protein [Sporodiniella umbellata]